MESYSDEFNNIFLSCKEKNYIIRHVPYLREFFEKKENLEMLRHSLTTKRNLTAIKIIDILGARILPLQRINQHTYTSIFWLYKMNHISPQEFALIQKRFEVMNNHKSMFEDTEASFIMQQMENKRHSYRDEKRAERKVSMKDLKFEYERNVTFLIDIDEFIDSEGVLEACTRDVRSVFRTAGDLTTLALFCDDGRAGEKTGKLRRIRVELEDGVRIPLTTGRLSREDRKKLDSFSSALNKLNRWGISYYLGSRLALGDILAVLYAHLRYEDFARVFQVVDGQHIAVSGTRSLVFGRCGNVPAQFFDLTLQNYIRVLEEKGCVPSEG